MPTRPAPEVSEALGQQTHVDESRRLSADLVAVVGAVALVTAAALAGWSYLHAGQDIILGFPPLLATWLPHVGPGTPVAALIAVAVAWRGPELARRTQWRPLLALAWFASLGWTLSLALIDGWATGVAGRLTTRDEYLYDVPKVGDIGAMLRTFSDHILTDQADFWTTHVGAHPPGAFLVFLLLDRAGLGGGGPAGLFVILVGSSAAVAVAAAVRALGAEDLARAALPFLVLFPGAVWIGVSADGMFAAVLAWGVALLAVGATSDGRRADVAALAGGLLLGGALYLSYGLVLGMLVPMVVLLVTRAWRAGAVAVVGVAVVTTVFTVAGFWWFAGYHDLRIIYAASAAKERPYVYFVWANLAALTCAIGPAVVAGLRRVARSVRRPRPESIVTLLVAAALVAVVIADLTGLSKAEVERIWLPFGIWLTLSCTRLPRRYDRGWLLAQAVLALAVNSLLLTTW